jgi:hypothetical protein
VSSPLVRLLASPEGEAAARVLVPLLGDLADYIAGRRDEPPALPEVPALKSELALERARFRAAHPGGEP